MKNIMMACALLLLAGCKMKEFSSTPLYCGGEVEFTGAVEDRVNLWPLAYWREPVGSIAWPLVSWGNDHLAFRPVYSQYKQRGSGVYDEYNLFWPMGQFDTKDDDYRLFPLFWGRDRGGDPYFCLFPAVWWINEFNGVLPFFWNDNAFCAFPLFWAKQEGESMFNTLFPLYYYNHNYNHNQDSIKFWAFCGLAGCTSNFDGSRRSQWAAPLFYHSDKAFLSIPFGYENLGARTNMYFAAGLAGIHSGTKEGGWLFPVYSKKKDSDFDEKLAIIDAAKLPGDIKTWTVIATNNVWNAKERRYEKKVGPRTKATSFYATDNRTHLLVSDNDRSISGSLSGGKDNAYQVSQRHEFGNVFAFRYEGERKVRFDLSTREKIGDTEKVWSALLGILYNHEHHADRMKGESHARHRVLWKLWDWQKENGDVSLDVFPGFAYDSKTNGYAKTSFLWRFFRYENDPDEGKKVDLFFIPLWR